MKKVLVLPTLLLLLSSCSSGTASTEKEGFFKRYEDSVKQEPGKEHSFFTLYDEQSNRFSLTFGYGLHFFYEIKITEYDLNDWYHSPNEGVFSSDYESISFTFNASSKSALFPDGRYVLAHEMKEGKDYFTLSVNGNKLGLTQESKEPPTFINPSLIGTFSYNESFSINVEVGELKDGRPIAISLQEGTKNFTGKNITHERNEVSFTLDGETDGEYLKRGEATLYLSARKILLSIGESSYQLQQKKDVVSDKSYFGDPEKKTMFYNEHVSLSLGNKLGEERRFVILSELDEGGRKNMQVLFSIEENGHTLKNSQNVNGNLIFTTGKEIKLTHAFINGENKIDLYLDGVLLYQDLSIQD